MLKDLFKRSLRREMRRSMTKIVTEAKQLKEALSDALDDVAGNADADDGLGDALDAQISPAEDNKIEELKIQQAVDKRNAQINEVIVGWVKKLDEFIEFINDPMNKESIKYIVDSAAPGSILEKIKSSESRRLTKVATECSALAQSLRSYITGGVEEESDDDNVEITDDDVAEADANIAADEAADAAMKEQDNSEESEAESGDDSVDMTI